MLQELEERLDSFDLNHRRSAIEDLACGLADGSIQTPPETGFINLHAHTFFSFNSFGYSPSKFAWLANKAGLGAAGIVDFDVLDGVDEFLWAAQRLNLRACGSIETRVFVPEFAEYEINSPGEPGIAYHMGAGLPTGQLTGKAKVFLDSLKATAQMRNRQMTERVNQYLSPAGLDFDKDVMPLTPAGNPTERHLCLAYAQKAKQHFKNDTDALLKFWQLKLGTALTAQDLPESPRLLNAIRARTMKQGGVGYVVPDAGAFPSMKQMNEFVLDAGGIPTLTWLNGLSAGEQRLEELLAIGMASGVAAFNMIPDRNVTPGVLDDKLVELQKAVRLCQERGLPILVGTEMNSPGQKFVDAFDTAELKPLLAEFAKGAMILYAHTVLEQKGRMGYVSAWSRDNFGDIRLKNDFYEIIGRTLEPRNIDKLDLSDHPSPRRVLELVQDLQ